MRLKHVLILCSLTFLIGLSLGSFVFKNIQKVENKSNLSEKKSEVIAEKTIQNYTIKLPDFIIKDLELAGIKSKDLTKEDWRGFLSFYTNKYVDNSDKKVLNAITNNKYNQTPIHLAAGAGLIDNVKQLVKLGYDINQKDRYGNTPLLLAIKNTISAEEALGLAIDMVKLGADLKVNQDSKFGFDLLKLSLDKDYNTRLVNYLQNNGLSFNDKHLYRLSKDKNKHFLYKYLDSLEINPQDSYNNKSVLESLILFGASNEIIDHVLNNNVDLKNDSSGFNALHAASISKTISIKNLEKIINSGIDVNSRVEGVTPLFHAVHNANMETIEFLLKNGAKIDVYDARGRSIYDIMEFSMNVDEKKANEMMKLFEKYSKKNTQD